MRFAGVLAAIGAVMLGSAPAQAVDFITYKFTGHMTGVLSRQPVGQNPTFTNFDGLVTFIYSVPLNDPAWPIKADPNGNVYWNMYSSTFFEGGSGGIRTDGNLLEVNESGGTGYLHTGSSIMLSACFASTLNGFPTAIAAVDPSCSPASLTYIDRYMSDKLTGSIDEVEILTGADAITSKEGFVRYTLGTPEPASWALMILGFGLSGLALRRARAPSSPAERHI